jgi:phosphate transport system substrate-binding protein
MDLRIIKRRVAGRVDETRGMVVRRRRWRWVASALVVFGLSATTAIGGEYDFDSLPSYQPARTESTHHCHGEVCHGEWGVIRIQGTEKFQPLIAKWQEGFLARHPNIRFADYFVPSGFAGLTTGTYDIGVIGHTGWRSDIMAFREVHGYDPLEIMFATGAFNQGKGNSPAPIFIVNKENPLSRLTLKQLDGIFGAERSGGWKPGYVWSTDAARTARDNIRTWGELGLTGEWADKPIVLYGFDATLSNWSELIQRVVFQGGDKWNPRLREMVRGGSKAPADAQIVDAIANDMYAIGFNLMRVIEKEPRVKPLALAEKDGGPYVQPTAQTIYERTYPLSNAVYIYINRKPGEDISPRLKEFLFYILSKEGQADIAAEGKYVPLNAKALLEQREKIK